MALKSSSIAGREEGSWSKLSSRPSGGKSSQRGRQVKALSSHIEHCHFHWLCEGQIVWWLFVYNGHQLMLPPRFLTSFAETLRPPPSSVLFSLFCFYLWSSSSPTGFTRSTKFVSIHICIYAYMQHVHLICNTYLPFPYPSHIMVIFAIVIIIVYSLHCLTTSGLESGGAWGTTFFRDFCQIKKKYDFDIHTVMKR